MKLKLTDYPAALFEFLTQTTQNATSSSSLPHRQRIVGHQASGFWHQCRTGS